MTCRECGTGRIVLRENLHLRQGLYTEPYLVCEECLNIVKVPYSLVVRLAEQLQSIANQFLVQSVYRREPCQRKNVLCHAEPTTSSVQGLLCRSHEKEVKTQAVTQAQQSMTAPPEQVREYYDTSTDDIADITVSCDGTQHKKGFSSQFGAVFIISHDTGKVLDYTVKSKHCASCSHWEARAHDSEEYHE